MTQVIQYNNSTAKRRNFAAAQLTDNEIKKKRWRKHIAEISKQLSTEPIQSEDLTCERQEWLNFRMARPFPKPYRWIDTKTEEAK